MRLQTLIITALIFILPIYANAVELQADSRTYFQVRENADDEPLLPLHEYLDLIVNDIGGKDISFHFGGWVRLDLNENESFNDKNADSDLQYAYLSFRRSKKSGFINVGRLQVYEGVASAEIVDGMHLGSDIAAGLRATAYGGVPVETDPDGREEDFIIGGRLSHSLPELYTIGVSVLYEQNEGDSFREESGFDLWLHPVSKVDLSGISRYNLDMSDWMEHTYYLTLGPFSALRLIGTGSWIDYEKYFSSMTSSVFLFSNGVIDPEEKVFMLGGLAEVRIGTYVSLEADYKKYDYDLRDNADYYGGAIRYSKPESSALGLSAHRMNGQTDRLKYYQLRVYAYKKLGAFDVTVDFIDDIYDEAINSVDNVYVASLAGGYDISPHWRFVANVDYAHTPEFDSDVRAFLKLLFNFRKS